MNRPGSHMGMRHVALNVRDMASSERFYVELLGMGIEWRPDPDNLYLSSGPDNLALHKCVAEQFDEAAQRLDHIGFFLTTPEAVDEWFEFLKVHGVRMRNEPRTHRDGARSFYCYDPDGVVVQIIYHPPVVDYEAECRS
ncbi:MAG: VOC family protein [Candidatus Thiodiazotropha sp. (ex. Lucinisca nassula)]|nr:VOC family protein [Candidatus Thiodiazotropha sp. (ex. Lucinisca nassula)]MBW9263819.1 VOC family protein [Candidatus Thiodiazotropha sp. (ex. Lucinisca nassula)]MBW9269553.1 VOC family protein [Candidatus Thiodiazotropha sp. (ex. Lucinisca nassula)]